MMRNKKESSKADIEMKALGVLGRAKFEAVLSSFRRITSSRGSLAADDVEFILRSNGFCPTISELREIQMSVARIGNNCDFVDFLQIALSCECITSTTGLSELVHFFSNFDEYNQGVVKVDVFRRIMLDCGESFTEEEVENLIEAFNSREKAGFIDYRRFITTITSS